MSIEDELKKEIALLTRENQQLTHQLFDYRAAFIRARDRAWVGLTEGEFRAIGQRFENDNGHVQAWMSFARHIQFALKEKNG